MHTDVDTVRMRKITGEGKSLIPTIIGVLSRRKLPIRNQVSTFLECNILNQTLRPGHELYHCTASCCYACEVLHEVIDGESKKRP